MKRSVMRDEELTKSRLAKRPRKSSNLRNDRWVPQPASQPDASADKRPTAPSCRRIDQVCSPKTACACYISELISIDLERRSWAPAPVDRACVVSRGSSAPSSAQLHLIALVSHLLFQRPSWA